MRVLVTFVRHGQTEWNVKNILQGHMDIPLNEEGIEQAYETAEALRDIEFDQVWTSDLQRARRTAEIILAKQSHKPSMIMDERLRERFLGDFEGHVYEPGKSHHSYSSAEAIEPFLERVLDWWDDLFPHDLDEMTSPLFRKQPSHDRIMQVLVVTHGGPIRRLVQSGLHQRRKFPFDPNAYLDPMFPPQSSHFTSLPPLRVGNCSITRILMDNQTSPRSEESSHSFEPMGMGMHRSSSQSLAERLVSLVPNLVGMRKGGRWHGVITAYADDQHIVRSSLRSSHDPTMTGDDYFTPQYSL